MDPNQTGSNLKQQVPQTTLHGLFLFLLYVNDITKNCMTKNCNINSEISQYADDTLNSRQIKTRPLQVKPKKHKLNVYALTLLLYI